MTTTAGTWTEAEPAVSELTGDAARGWYLYGITRRGPLADALAEADAGEELAPEIEAAPLELLEFSSLAAVVRPVLLVDFSPAVLQERLRSAPELEALVRSHNRVTEAVQRRQAILPAKFGSVYARAEDVVLALEPVHDALLRQLERVEGCDEWAVHLYAEPAVVRERIAAEDPTVRRLRDECASARPGRAYFLEQQLRDELEAATGNALGALAQDAFDRLADRAVAAEVGAVGAAAAAGEVEILRAAFLVPRADLERFQAEVHALGDAGAGLRCEQSGPWPPYSFAAAADEEAE